ncbi:hypothetical protein [Legionella sp. km772]|uniref:hypothetical protein n=1 Tax=Legionella sp. km772 TaxID=2498111 RepID=UPI000F8DC6F0|nr:hypothetical protein [Legionella sp. km772]RUR09804.1 hypothetical protein ELY15_08840 [Legionella sp. km772]
MSAGLGMGMWRVFCNTSKKGAEVLFQASKTSVIETGRATAGTGLVLLGFFAYDRVTANTQPRPQVSPSPQEININFDPSPK